MFEAWSFSEVCFLVSGLAYIAGHYCLRAHERATKRVRIRE
jgi:hypothetical protein